jgi:Tfp pilus assembly protein FimT
MLVVISMIALIAGITLPSIVRLFRAGAEEQAYNILAAQLTSARALAVREGTYAGVHIQRADATDELYDQRICYAAVVVFDRFGDKTQGEPDVVRGR